LARSGKKRISDLIEIAALRMIGADKQQGFRDKRHYQGSFSRMRRGAFCDSDRGDKENHC